MIIWNEVFLPKPLGSPQQIGGSARESEQPRTLGGFPEHDEFGFRGGHSLRFQKEVAKVLVPATTANQRFDVAVDSFHDTQRDLGPAVVQDAIDMIEQRSRQLPERLQTLPAKLIDPILQIPDHGPLVPVVPQPVQTLLEQIGLE